MLANLGFGLLLDSVPPASQAAGADLIADTGPQAGAKWPMVAVLPGNIVIPFVGGFGSPPFTDVQAGDKVHIDNSLVIGLQYYNRYQDPNGDPEYYAWDAWRDENGDPIHVQRDVIAGLERATSSAGCVESGKFQGKMAVVNNLMDIDATPWYADWYRTQVKKFLGNKIDKRYRLYYNDHAHARKPGKQPGSQRSHDRLHGHAAADGARRDGVGRAGQESSGEHALLGRRRSPDQGAAVARPAARGQQPVVTLLANGRERADI